uniref:F-box domain-containing protein n=1 Tax=Moniliophthora roreri TaxID=221103 RepID=A0A0W0G3X2_MONRR
MCGPTPELLDPLPRIFPLVKSSRDKEGILRWLQSFPPQYAYQTLLPIAQHSGKLWVLTDNVLPPTRLTPDSSPSFVQAASFAKPTGYLHAESCKVCYYWRLVSLANPRLWAKLEVEPDFSNPLHPATFRDLKRYIERAQSAPMDNTLTIDYDDGTLLADVLEAPLASSSQWHSLEYDVGEDRVVDTASIILEYAAENYHLSILWRSHVAA